MQPDNRDLLAQIVRNNPIATFVLDADHRVTHWNRACESLNLMPAPSMVGSRDQWRAFYDTERPVLADLVLDDAFDEIRSRYGSSCRPSALIENAWEATAFFPNFRSGAKWLYFTAAPLRGLDGRIVGAVETLQDITAQKAYEAQLEHRANYDPLTGLANRRSFQRHFDVCLAQAQRDGKTLMLAILDLDHFKLYNDHYGHKAGDRALQQVALVLGHYAARPMDMAIRLGGEEFGLLSYADEASALTRRMQHLLAQLQGLHILHEYSPTASCLTASIGIAQAEPAATTDSLFLQADAQLYRAKEAGRNRVCGPDISAETGSAKPAEKSAVASA